MKDKGCNICGSTDQKRYSVVKKELCGLWSEITGHPLVTNDRVCPNHLPKGWKEKYADRIPSSAPDPSIDPPVLACSPADPGTDPRPFPNSAAPSQRKEPFFFAPQGAVAMLPPSPLGSTGRMYRLYAQRRGGSPPVSIVVAVDAFRFVGELASEIEDRYKRLFPKTFRKKVSFHFSSNFWDVNLGKNTRT